MSTNMAKEVMRIVSSPTYNPDNHFMTSMQIAEIFGREHPDILKAKYRNSVSFLSRALGNVTKTLVIKHKLENDGTDWPGIKKYRAPAIEQTSGITVDKIVNMYIEANFAKDENEALHKLAKIALEDHKDEFKDIIEKFGNAKEALKKLDSKK